MADEASPATRIRLAFHGKRLIHYVCKSFGMKRCWILINPSIHSTISDLSDYIVAKFALNSTCPNGIILSIDEFTLPKFESIDILKAKDIIRVSRQKEVFKDQAMMKQIEHSRAFVSEVKLLGYEKIEGENGDCCNTMNHEPVHLDDGSDSENPPVSRASTKKRKRANKTRESKRKKAKPLRHEQQTPVAVISDGTDVDRDEILCLDGGLSRKACSSEGMNLDDVEVHDCTESEFLESKNPLQDNPHQLEKASEQAVSNKLPSRSARRKKAKRQWLRKMVQAKCIESDTKAVESNTQLQIESSASLQLDQDEEGGEDEMVPVVVKPGHIRFVPAKGQEPENLQTEDVLVQNNIRWNGITSKKKGQKWGLEKNFWAVENSVEVTPKDLPSEGNMTTSDIVGSEELHFEKLASLTGLPELGQIIAYRLIELSPSWCPEVSPFRVGKMVFLEPDTNRIKLIPVSSYPLDTESMTNCPDSLYNEDGSLEIEFTSLIDVRALNCKKGDSPSSNGNEVSTLHTTHENEVEHPKQQVGQSSWDEICEALDKKKAELCHQEDSETAKKSRPNGSRPYRALRNGALGPIISLLRAENGIREKVS